MTALPELRDMCHIRRYLVDECGVVPGDPVGWLIASHRALTNARRPPIPESPTNEYRSCLDALIVTIEHLRAVNNEIVIRMQGAKYTIEDARREIALDAAESRAAELAGRLFEKYIGEWS